MEGLLLPLLLVPFGLVVAAVLGAIAFTKVKQLELRVGFLEQQLQQRATPASTNDITAITAPVQTQPPAAANAPMPAPVPKSAPQPSPAPVYANAEISPIDRLFNHVRQHWMVWLGGSCVGLAGIFMVRYSIEQQLLSPAARLLLAGITGAALHGVAEWLRRHKGVEQSFAALAGGASIILYASLLGAFRLLDNPAVGWIFAGMALVSLATMLLTLRHGPMLAALGMLGGYLVPVLVDSGSGKIEYALIYVLIISLFTLWLMAYVHKTWLWQGVAVAGLIWWLISFSGSPGMDIRSLYLTALLYLLVAVPNMDWRLQKNSSGTELHWWAQLSAIWQDNGQKQLWLVTLAIVVAQGITWWVEDIGHVSYLGLLALPLLLAQLALRRPELNGLLALLLALTALDWLLYQQGSLPETNSISLRLLAITAFYVAIALLWRKRVNVYSSFWLALGCAAPLLMLAVAFYQLDFIAQEWAWSLAAFILALSFSALALSWQSEPKAMSQVVLFSAAHVAYSLAAVMFLVDASLTMALSVQMLSLSWLLRRYQLAGLGWALRLVLTLVLIRLTFNPWLLNYGNGNLWVPWIYSTALVCALASTYWLKEQIKLQPWLIGGSAQLLVLTLAVWVRWWLYDGEIYQQTLSFSEASIYAVAWGVLALLYQWRAQHSEYAVKFYQLLANLHGAAAILMYLLYVLLDYNPLWSNTSLASTPLWNMLLLSYGAPTLLLTAWLWQIKHYYWAQNWLRPVAMATAINAWFFVSIEIRHLWHLNSELHLRSSMPTGELYTYSAVWLLGALLVLVWSLLKQQSAVYKAGMVLLLVVVAKIFLLDMVGLSGLWRVASFMGLGLTLLALAWLYQKTAKQARINPPA